MRRKDRCLSNTDTFNILEKGEYGVLSTVSFDGEPYGVPFNYCLINENIYFHCALEGHAIRNIEKNPHISFCVVGETEILPEKFGTIYESCIVQGSASEAFLEEKQLALEGLVHKYSDDFFSKGLEYIQKLKAKTRVFRISIASISGKARK